LTYSIQINKCENEELKVRDTPDSQNLIKQEKKYHMT